MTNESSPVLLDVDGHLATVTLNRPEVLNAINPPLTRALGDAMRKVRDDPSIWAAIITGAGERAFSAGADLKWRSENEEAVRAPGKGRVRTGFLSPDFHCWKPVIAAVNGYAVGGGLELALACDMIVAAEHAQFGLPEPRRGLMADAGGVHGLVRQLPLKLAMELILTGKFIGAREALRMGLVNAVVPASELMDAARGFARQVFECSPLAVQAAKEAATLGLELPFREAMTTTFPAFERLRASRDFVEGPRAFAEKRKPVWEGQRDG